MPIVWCVVVGCLYENGIRFNIRKSLWFINWNIYWIDIWINNNINFWVLE